MDYDKKVNKIKKMLDEGKSNKSIIEALNMNRFDFYNLCNREGFKYNKQAKIGGRKIGAKDLSQRVRRTRAEIKKGGNIQAINEIEHNRRKQQEETQNELNKYESYLNTKKGGNNNLKKNKYNDIDTFLNNALEEAERPLTTDEIKNLYNASGREERRRS